MEPRMGHGVGPGGGGLAVAGEDPRPLLDRLMYTLTASRTANTAKNTIAEPPRGASASAAAAAAPKGACALIRDPISRTMLEGKVRYSVFMG